MNSNLGIIENIINDAVSQEISKEMQPIINKLEDLFELKTMRASRKMITMAELSKKLSLKREVILRLHSTGEIDGFNLGGKWLFEENSVDDYITRQCEQSREA